MRRVVRVRRPATAALARALTTAVLTTAVLAAAGCGSPERGRTAVPDDVLLEQLAAVPGVAAVDVRFEDDVTTGPMYSGAVTVEPGADERCVLDTVNAILWQGRTAALQVALQRADGSAGATNQDLDVSGNPLDDAMAARYGERPDGPAFRSPEPPPACA